MKTAVMLSGHAPAGARTWQIVSDLSSFLLHDPLGSPLLVGLEYRLPEGTAWTLAASNDDDFYKILSGSGILHTVVPGFRPGRPNLLCTPVLRKGVPRWFDDVESLVVSNDDNTPFFLAYKTSPDQFQSVYYHQPQFKERLQLLWNHR